MFCENSASGGYGSFSGHAFFRHLTSSSRFFFDGENCDVWAYSLTEIAKRTSSVIYYFGWIGALFVKFLGGFQHVFGAEVYAKSASSTSLFYYVDFSSWNLGFVRV